ncbi:MAG TPA: hypothetical protein VGD64_03360 [Acidisarcina sp.]
MRPKARQSPAATQAYRGKQTRTGNSLGFRTDNALFKSHPEFAGEVEAHVIAPGRMLVSISSRVPDKRDPVMNAFLAFLASDMKRSPESIAPLDGKLSLASADWSKTSPSRPTSLWVTKACCEPSHSERPGAMEAVRYTTVPSSIGSVYGPSRGVKSSRPPWLHFTPFNEALAHH